MASCSSLSEELFLCSLCLEVFIRPVMTPCGHNFCKACITQCWDSSDQCQCPVCKNTFDKRPDLYVNTFISEMAAPFRRSVPVKASSSPDQHPDRTEVSCDVCTGKRLRALKSCLVCQTSYCETHLEPHQRVAGLKKHKLIDPVENPEDRMCERHDRPLELFCKTDQTCVCRFCTETDHKTHDTVSLEEECGKKKVHLGKTGGEVQQVIQERLQKVQEIKLSVKTSKTDTEREISDSVQVFTAMVSSIERSQAELIQVIEEKQKATEKQAAGFIEELKQEITELKRRSSELEQLSHTDDHLHLLQSFPSLSTPPHTKDWSRVRVQSSVGTGRRVVSQLEDTLTDDIKKLCDAELKRIQQYAVDVTLDRDTAYPSLVLSNDGKQVRERDGKTEKDVFYNPKRFVKCVCVLGQPSFSSGRFYYEVQVKGKTDWALGVARESVERKRKITLCPKDGYWAMRLSNGHEYKAGDPAALLSLRGNPQQVGVFVDYEEGQVSFYDVEARSRIYSYTGCRFTEKLYPYFSPATNDCGKNSAPLVITPMNLVRH